VKIERVDGEIVTITMEKWEASLLAEALDSHAYWQLSEEGYRNDGSVMHTGSDDADVAEEIADCEALADVLNEATR
jgi:hypothetical protein